MKGEITEFDVGWGVLKRTEMSHFWSKHEPWNGVKSKCGLIEYNIDPEQIVWDQRAVRCLKCRNTLFNCHPSRAWW